jgi:predicted TPR repeat methyltransferase
MHVRLSSPWLPLGIILLLTVALYARAVSFGFVSLDDPLLVTGNPLIMDTSFRGILAMFSSYDPELYIPITFLSLALEYMFVGSAPWLYHATNIALHLLSTALIFGILLRMKIGVAAASVGAAFFALHPINVEAVAWVSARKDLLSTAFAFGSLYAALPLLQDSGWQWNRRGFFALLLFFCALLSKVSVVLLPLGWLLILWNAKRCSWKLLRQLLPFFFLSTLFLLIAILGKQKALPLVSASELLLIFARATALQLKHIFLTPWDLAVFYPVPRPIGPFLPPYAGSMLLPLVIGFTGWLFSRRSRQIGLLTLLFFVFFLPSIATVQKGTELYLTSDRYVYSAMLPIAAFVGIALQWLWQRSRGNTIRRGLLLAITGLLATAMTGMAHDRIATWATNETFLRTALHASPAVALLHYNLGRELALQGKTAEAQVAFEETLRIDPTFAEAAVNIGFLVQEQGEHTEAIDHYRRALQIDPTSAHAWLNIGAILMDEGKFHEAILALERATDLEPHSARAWRTLGSAYGKLSRYQDGLEAYRKAMALDPRLKEELATLEKAMEGLEGNL